ncbi:hypothetical protein M422DRAFT_46372 [Sphaerobolus stellatus SS14]|uniref:Uncharacterized protein n=1 Tax=Sphaerobolus stellatus (strain SS14) TaxID=990650 RepID=A0A0C9W2Z6_SPHS4|nr:hypothetical protein M422DRAFT_46372 [Sphaerobolus stellatus SS14]
MHLRDSPICPRLTIETFISGVLYNHTGVLEFIAGVTNLKRINIRTNLSPFKFWENVDRFPATHHVMELRLTADDCQAAEEEDSAKMYLLLLICYSLKHLEISLQGIARMDKPLLPASSSSKICD